MANPLLPFGNSLRPTPGLMQQQPRSFGDRVRGILGSIGQGAQGLGMGLLGAQQRSELGPGLADFGARMLSASAPDARGTFGGALGDSLMGTRQELEYQRDLQAQEAQMQQAGQALQGYLPEDLQGMGLPPELIQSIALQRMMTPKQALNVGPGQVGVFDPVQGSVDIQGQPLMMAPEPVDLDWQKIKDGGREILLGLNPQTGEEVARYEGAEAEQLGGMDPANRNEYLAWKKEYGADTEEARTVATAVEKLQDTSPNPAGDVSLVFQYMKILDPGSTVREGEQATARNAGGVPAWVRAQYNRVIGDAELDTTMREQFKREGLITAAGYLDRVDQIRDYYRRSAEDLGMNADIIISDDPLAGIRSDLEGVRQQRGANPLTGR